MLQLRRCSARCASWVAGAFLVVLAAPVSAQPILIDFEQVAGMTNSPGSTIPAASQLRDQYLASHGVRFSSGSLFAAVVVHGANTPSGTRIVGGSTAGGTLTYQSGNPVVAEFFDATGTVPLTVTVVSVRGDLQPIPGTKTLEAYGLDGTLLGVDTQLDSSTLPLMVSALGIHRVRMYSSSATVGFDDLRFDAPGCAAQPVIGSITSTVACTRGEARVVATSADTPEYQWRWRPAAGAAWINVVNGLNTDALAGPGGFLASDAHTDTLTIRPSGTVSASSQWVMSCVVSNGCGGVASDAITMTICAADANCDGFLDFGDFDDFVTAFEAGAPGADFDGDGFLTFEDFDAFVAAFEAGC
jgi:hypothetical protein